MAVTQAELREIFYDILRETEGDATAYPTNLANLFLDSSQLRICSWQVTNPINRDTARKGQLPFINEDVFYSNITTTTLSVQTSVWATELDVADTTNFPTAWNLYIAGNIVTYTWKTSTQFTGCTNVKFAFKAWVEVSIAFEMPSDYMSVINITYNNRFKLPQKLYDDIFEDLNKYKWSHYERNNNVSIQWNTYRVSPFYTIIDNQYLVIFNLNDPEWSIFMRYEKVPPEMSDSQWPIIDNDIYAKTTIPYWAVAEMLFNRWEETRAAEIISFAMWQIREMYNYYNNRSYEKLNGVAYKMWKSVLNI